MSAKSEPKPTPGDSTSWPDAPRPILDMAPIRDKRLRPRDHQVLWALCQWAWGFKAYCFPTDPMIAELLGCSERTVTYSLKRLQACGYITRHMNRTKTGWYRTIIITDRVPRPKLAIIEPPAGGGPATDCGTPPQSVAGPPPQRIAGESSSEAGKKEKRNSGTATSPKGGGSPSPKGKAGNPEPEDRPIEEMTTAEADGWREMGATPGHPFRAYARKMVEIYERHQASLREPGPFRLGAGEKPDPGSPTKDPQGPASRVDGV